EREREREREREAASLVWARISTLHYYFVKKSWCLSGIEPRTFGTRDYYPTSRPPRLTVTGLKQRIYDAFGEICIADAIERYILQGNYSFRI
ncbi:MAG: hypothetical protein KTM48_02340, partial [Wolbachia endosymbiont of Pissodes strobi]|nr:hypothetical protein [Wolbachia endosymbiont of Pissodes strobi]